MSLLERLAGKFKPKLNEVKKPELVEPPINHNMSHEEKLQELNELAKYPQEYHEALNSWLRDR
ncbi:MAG: hypothetical protein Q8P92_03015 [Candidatus Daviesbacteria bacterium]|nr:hypothetical protein [Candidatus Daviesbacteria bacterium]